MVTNTPNESDIYYGRYRNNYFPSTDFTASEDENSCISSSALSSITLSTIYENHLLRVRDINWTNERPQLVAAALSAVAFVLSVFGSFHCSFATSNTYLFGIFGYGVRGDECIAFDEGDELYDVDQFWSIAKVASILAVALGLFAMNFIWCTIVYGYGRNLIVAILLMAALCQCFIFLFFESSLCKKHFFACYYGPGSYCCAAAVVLWIYIAVTISCCNDLKHANNNYLI